MSSPISTESQLTIFRFQPASASLQSIACSLVPATVPHPIAILHSATPPAALSPFFVLDLDFPAPEPIPSPHHLPSQFSATFGLPFICRLGNNHVRPFSTPELFLCYSAYRRSPFRRRSFGLCYFPVNFLSISTSAPILSTI